MFNSTVSVFVNFGARVDAGFPFFVHKYHDTGDWIGPLSVVMAQNETAVLDIDNVVDQYSIRYVQTPTTPYLRMDPNCTLFSPDDFQKYMGMTAVKETIKVQSNATHGKDPYEQYLGTCQNGDVRPILPLMEFTFVESPDQPEKESVQVQLDYKVLSFPHKSDIMYKLFPRLQKRLNQPGSGFHVSGPYCYGEDPKRGYTFDFTYDSRHETNLLDLVHGCVEGEYRTNAVFVRSKTPSRLSNTISHVPLNSELYPPLLSLSLERSIARSIRRCLPPKAFLVFHQRLRFNQDRAVRPSFTTTR